VKRVIGLVFICGAASSVAVTAAPTPPYRDTPQIAAAPSKAIHAPTADELARRAAEKEAARHAAMVLLAPADEYFGPLKLSIIGMRNTIRDLGLRYDVNHDIPKQTFASAQLVERSVRDWQTKYARDPQLPRVIFVLQRLYTKILLRESRDRARATAAWLQRDFSRTPQARQIAKTLAAEHLAPLPPEPTPTPEPEPTFASIFGRGYPSEFAPLPSASPLATPASGGPGAGRPVPRPALPAATPLPTPASPTPLVTPTAPATGATPAAPVATPPMPSPAPAPATTAIPPAPRRPSPAPGPAGTIPTAAPPAMPPPAPGTTPAPASSPIPAPPPALPPTPAPTTTRR